jgi:hypothetical protein
VRRGLARVFCNPGGPVSLWIAAILAADQVEKRRLGKIRVGLNTKIEAGLPVGVPDGTGVADDQIAMIGLLNDPFKPGPLVQQALVAIEAGDRAHTGAQLDPVEWLGDKVIGAGLDPLQP